MLAPPTEYIAGADHLPLKFPPRRQSKGPRPPLPPTPTPNFFTSGKISTQLALSNTLGEMSLLFSISCNTRLARRRVSSSFCLSAANTRGISRNMEGRKQSKALLVVRALVFLQGTRSMGPFLLSCLLADWTES